MCMYLTIVFNKLFYAICDSKRMLFTQNKKNLTDENANPKIYTLIIYSMSIISTARLQEVSLDLSLR